MESVDFLLESESEPESDFWIFPESESEPESGCTWNRASLGQTTKRIYLSAHSDQSIRKGRFIKIFMQIFITAERGR